MDASAQKALLEMALEYAEAYTGRKLQLDDYTEEAQIAGNVALLSAYPVEEVRSVRVDGEEVAVEDVRIDKTRGVLTLPRTGDLCEVEYTGGYDELPKPIQTACAMLAASITQAASNGGQQVTFMALDGFQVTYSAKGAAGNELEMLSPVAAVMLRPYCAKAGIKVIR